MDSDEKTSSEELDEICLRLNPATVLNPHKSMLGTGNYDINVIMSALNSRYVHFHIFCHAEFMIFRSYQAVWHDKRKKVSSIELARVSGVILNTMSTMQVGFFKLPIRRRHWVAIQVKLTFATDRKAKVALRMIPLKYIHFRQ